MCLFSGWLLFIVYCHWGQFDHRACYVCTWNWQWQFYSVAVVCKVVVFYSIFVLDRNLFQKLPCVWLCVWNDALKCISKRNVPYYRDIIFYIYRANTMLISRSLSYIVDLNPQHLWSRVSDWASWMSVKHRCTYDRLGRTSRRKRGWDGKVRDTILIFIPYSRFQV